MSSSLQARAFLQKFKKEKSALASSCPHLPLIGWSAFRDDMRLRDISTTMKVGGSMMGIFILFGTKQLLGIVSGQGREIHQGGNVATGSSVEMALYSAGDHLSPRKTPPLWGMLNRTSFFSRTRHVHDQSEFSLIWFIRE